MIAGYLQCKFMLFEITIILLNFLELSPFQIRLPDLFYIEYELVTITNYLE